MAALSLPVVIWAALTTSAAFHARCAREVLAMDTLVSLRVVGGDAGIRWRVLSRTHWDADNVAIPLLVPRFYGVWACKKAQLYFKTT